MSQPIALSLSEHYTVNNKDTKMKTAPVKIRNIDALIRFQQKMDKEKSDLLEKDKQERERVRKIKIELGISEDDDAVKKKIEEELIEKSYKAVENLKREMSGLPIVSDDTAHRSIDETNEKGCEKEAQPLITDDSSRRMKPKVKKRYTAIQDRPKWLEALCLGPKKHAREERILRMKLHKLQSTACKNNDGNKERIKHLSRRLNDMAVTPRLNYEKWTEHLTIVPGECGNVETGTEKRNQSEEEDNYYRFDSIGWLKEQGGYIMALRSPLCDRNGEEIYKVSHRHKMRTAGKFLLEVENGEENGNICKVLELGSGSGQHAVMFCERNPRTVLWQPSDRSQRCIDSVDRRAELCSVKRDESAGTEKMWTFAKEKVVIGGIVFIYGTFWDKDVPRNDHHSSLTKLDLRLKKLCPDNGVRLLEDVVKEAQNNCFCLERQLEMEFRHTGLLFRRVEDDSTASYRPFFATRLVF